jgi:hypothetical protein
MTDRLILVLLAVTTGACAVAEKHASVSQPGVDSNAGSSAAALRTGERLGHDETNAPAGLDACRMLGHATSSLDTLRRWPRTLLTGGSDTCIIALLDSLADAFERSGDAAYLEVLDSIHAVDDGYVAEYVSEVVARAARARFAMVFEYLFERRMAVPPLEQALTDGLRQTASTDEQGRHESLLAIIRSAMSVAELDPLRRAYLDRLLREAGLTR